MSSDKINLLEALKDLLACVDDHCRCVEVEDDTGREECDRCVAIRDARAALAALALAEGK